jgi:general secretion pathway protein D
MMKRKLICIFLLLFLTVSALAVSSSECARNNEDLISFNFVDVEISSVIKFISEITAYNFIFDERIKGKITIIAPTRLTINESFSLFTSVLSLKGYTIIPAGETAYKIIPSSLAKQAGQISPEETVQVNEGYITKLIPTAHIKADDAVRFLKPVISRDGHIASFGPRNLLLIVDSAVNIGKISSILKLIDKPSDKEEPSKINVYFLENADAEDLAKVLQGILKDIKSSYRAGSKAKQNPQTSIPVLSITPDKSTNSLIIVSPTEDYENILQIIKTLDKRRKQVYVEAIILEASIDKLRELGTKWRVIAEHNGEPVAIGGFGEITSSTILDIVGGLTGFSTGGMGNFLDIPVTAISSDGSVSTQTLTAPGFAVLFSLNEFKDAINILSTPQILTSDNEEAEIVVGENVPFIGQRERDVVTSGTVVNSIVRTNVGITLRLTPQITEGDYVKLDIYQEISLVKDASEEILITVGPTTTIRSTDTSVIVKDGHTVVIGGLMQETEEEIMEKMPFFGDIPIFGWLFRAKSKSKIKRNLLVFLSPHIVKESEKLDNITREKHKTFSLKEKLYSEGELMVKFNDTVSRDRAKELVALQGATILKYFKSIGIYQVRLNPKQTVKQALEEFTQLPEVQYAEPNYILKIKDRSAMDQEAASSDPSTKTD